MAYLDITPTDTGFKTQNGDFKLTDRSIDIAANILLTNPGGYKYAPTVGGGANSFINSTARGAKIQRAFTVALKAAGFNKPIVSAKNGVVTVNNDEVLVFNS